MIRRIAPDKWKHLFVGILMGACLECFFLFIIGASLGWSTILATAVSIAVGYGFELYSLFTGHGHYEFLDAVATVIGAALGIGIIMAIA